MSAFSFSIRERIIFAGLVLVCCVYAAYMYIYRPSVVRSEEIFRETVRAGKKLSEQAAVIQKEKRMAEIWQGELDAVGQNNSNEEAMSAMLSEIEAVTGQMKIRVTEMKPQGAIKGEFYNTYAVSLAVDGDLKDILEFIHILQDPSRHLSVRQFSLEKSFADSTGMLAKVVVESTLLP